MVLWKILRFFRAISSGEASSSSIVPIEDPKRSARSDFFQTLVAKDPPATNEVNISIESIHEFQGEKLAMNPEQALKGHAPPSVQSKRARPNYDGRKRKLMAAIPVERKQQTI